MNPLLLNPISVIINIIRASREYEKREVRQTIIGSAPYHPPEDSGWYWRRIEPEDSASGEVEYTRIIRLKGKP
jgi:hypothetical protein